MSIVQNLPPIVMAIGGLGTAAFGLVDSTKVFWGGVNRIGFGKIKKTVSGLTPGALVNGLNQDRILDTLRANWYNGQDLASQKSVAKTLIKLGLNTGNATDVAKATGVDGAALQSIASKIVSGTALSSIETDVFSRFDMILTALLDETYQNSDQIYTNGTRFLASFFAVALAFAGGWVINAGPLGQYWWTRDMWEALIVGIVATPLAPIAKDLSSALSTAVNTLQIVKK
ncbi:MAG TPA: hypothetical protein VMA34_19175 [Terracidiphilus sp.]|nr:hypothetical protein [Terracidiphilus sp.]